MGIENLQSKYLENYYSYMYQFKIGQLIEDNE